MDYLLYGQGSQSRHHYFEFETRVLHDEVAEEEAGLPRRTLSMDCHKMRHVDRVVKEGVESLLVVRVILLEPRWRGELLLRLSLLMMMLLLRLAEAY